MPCQRLLFTGLTYGEIATQIEEISYGCQGVLTATSSLMAGSARLFAKIQMPPAV